MRTIINVIVFCLFAASGWNSQAAVWTQLVGQTEVWQTNLFFEASCSADGNTIFALLGTSQGGIPHMLGVISTNAGLSWFTNKSSTANLGGRNFDYTTCSADGSVLAVLGAVSTNFGVTWQTNSGWPKTYGLASSADGRTLYATGDYVSVSTNFGLTWANMNVPYGLSWNSVATSADGNTVVASWFYGLYITTNRGATWTSNTLGNGSALVTCSADGTKMAAGAGTVYYSTNSGTTWALGNAPDRWWRDIAASADGRCLFAVATSDGPWLYQSEDYGAHWTSNAVPLGGFHRLAVSADGNRMVGVSRGPDVLFGSYTAPTPQLKISTANGSAKLSWGVPATNLVLQESVDLVSWTPVTNQTALDLTNIEHRVTVTSPTTQTFFRLAAP